MFTPTQCSPPNSRACSILTQRSITVSSPAARVVRDGAVHLIPAREVVPGDIVLLEAGDVILTGTPSGVAMGHKESNWFLNGGDVLESELQGIGTMRNRIVDAPDAPTSWAWGANA